MSSKTKTSGHEDGHSERDQDESADVSNGKRVSWEARRKYLNEKYADELEAARSMSPEELRRLRRRISNRESARRLRKQRSEKLGELQEQQGSLEDKFQAISEQIITATLRLQSLEAENAALQAQLGEIPTPPTIPPRMSPITAAAALVPPTSATNHVAPVLALDQYHSAASQQPTLKRTATAAGLDTLAPPLKPAAPATTPPTASANACTASAQCAPLPDAPPAVSQPAATKSASPSQTTDEAPESAEAAAGAPLTKPLPPCRPDASSINLAESSATQQPSDMQVSACVDGMSVPSVSDIAAAVQQTLGQEPRVDSVLPATAALAAIAPDAVLQPTLAVQR